MPAIALTAARVAPHPSAAAGAEEEAALERLFGSPGPWSESPEPGGPYLCPVYGTQLRGGAVMAVAGAALILQA